MVGSRASAVGVEISADGGKTWRNAKLQEPVLPLAHARFRLDWRWDGREAVLQSRCTDETGYVQPTPAELAKVRGRNFVVLQQRHPELEGGRPWERAPCPGLSCGGRASILAS